MSYKIELPPIPEEELTPTVKSLLNIISQQAEIINQLKLEIQQLKDEIARLKGGNKRPKIAPSILDGNFQKVEKRSRKERRKKKIK